MKRNFVLMSVILCSAFVSHAQIKKGAILLGGNIGFSKQSTKEGNQVNLPVSQSSLTMNPAFGKAIKENLVIGADILFNHLTTDYTFSDDQRFVNAGIGFFARKYKYLGNNFYLFGQGRLGFDYISNENWGYQGMIYTKTHAKGYSVAAGLYPGISYAINSKLQLETGFANLVYINFSHAKTTNEFNLSPEYITNSFSVRSSLSNFSGLTIGVRYLINKQS